MLCPGCSTPTLFETPPCTDGHLECPERACTRCGTAVLVGALPDDLAGGSAVRAAA